MLTLVNCMDEHDLYQNYLLLVIVRANQQSIKANPSMEEQRQRRQSVYDENGFKTDQFSLRILQYLNNQEEVIERLNRWKEIIPTIKQLKEQNQRMLIHEVRKGIPDCLRRQVWPQLVMKPLRPYSHYCGKLELKQIDLDLDRTFPNNKIVKKITDKMRSVLNAVAYALPELGYCQGMNFICAIILLKLDQEQSFNMMHHIFHWQKHQNLLKNLDEIHRKMYILNKLVKRFYSKLHTAFSQFQIHCLYYAAPWFITMFCNTLPCAYVLRILQMYLLEGEKILYRVALQILKIKKSKLKKLKEFELIMEQMKNFQDLVTTESEINNFFKEMFQINLSRKEIQAINKEYELKQLKKDKKQ